MRAVGKYGHGISMKDKIVVYEKPTCTKCREMDKVLRESGVDYERINYYIQPLGAAKLQDLLKKLAIPLTFSKKLTARPIRAVSFRLELFDRYFWTCAPEC